MAYRLINDSFETLGEWFLPEKSDNKIPGSLHYAKGNIELILNNQFRPLSGNISLNDLINQKYTVIHGVTREGEAITLLDNHRSSANISMGTGGYKESEKIKSLIMLIGGHVSENFVYPTVRFRIPGLTIWLSKHLVTHGHFYNDDLKVKEVRFSIPEFNIESVRITAIQSDLSFEFTDQPTIDFYKSINVEIDGWVSITPDTPKTLYWYIEQYQKISTLLAIMSGSPMATDCIEASPDASYRRIYIMAEFQNTYPCTFKHINNFFMPRKALGINLSSVICNWFDIYKTIEMPSKLAMSIFASSNLWMHVEFLSLMQALEGFHRALFDGKYIQEDEYETIENVLIAAIPSIVSQDHKSSLKSRIHYGNELSLRKRLDNLVLDLSLEIRKKILGDFGKIPQSWVDTRNYYTHWDKKLHSNVLNNIDMHYSNTRMRILLRVLYLKLTGISQKTILESLSGKSEIAQYLIQLNSRNP